MFRAHGLNFITFRLRVNCTNLPTSAPPFSCAIYSTRQAYLRNCKGYLALSSYFTLYCKLSWYYYFVSIPLQLSFYAPYYSPTLAYIKYPAAEHIDHWISPWAKTRFFPHHIIRLILNYALANSIAKFLLDEILELIALIGSFDFPSEKILQPFSRLII